MLRKNFPFRKEQRRKEAKERQALADAKKPKPISAKAKKVKPEGK